VELWHKHLHMYLFSKKLVLITKLRRRWEDDINMFLQEMGCGVQTGSSWLRIGTGGRHF